MPGGVGGGVGDSSAYPIGPKELCCNVPTTCVKLAAVRVSRFWDGRSLRSALHCMITPVSCGFHLGFSFVVTGPLFPEPVRAITTVPMGDSAKLIGKGQRTNQVHEPVLTPEQIARLEASPETEPYDGDSTRFKLAIEALRLGPAYEYDPYFSLSIERVDPLPHRLEAVPLQSPGH